MSQSELDSLPVVPTGPLSLVHRLGASDRAVLALGALTLLGAGLRFVTLGDQSLWADEAVTAALVRKSFDGMLSTIPHTESTPPLFYMLEWLWVRVAGTSEAGLRALSATAGTVTIPVAYAATRALLTRRFPALAVALFAAVSPILVWYSQEARSYALYVLLDAIALLFLARAVREPSQANLWSWAASASLALLTHYFAGLFAVGCAAVLMARLRKRAVPCVAFVMLVGAALVPLARYQAEHQQASAWISGASLPFRIQEVVERFVFLFYNPGRSATVVAAAVVAVLLGWRARRFAGARIAFVVAAFAAGIPLILAVSRLIDVFYYRNLLAIWLALAVVVAAGIPSSRAGAAFAVLLALPPLAATVRIASSVELQRDSWRPAVVALRAIGGQRIVASDYLDEPYTLPYYWPSLQPIGSRGASVLEVDLVGHYLNARTRIEALPTFRPFRTIKAGNLTIVRLRAASPERVTDADLPGGGGLLARG